MMRYPRRKERGHLQYVRQLPCVICEDNTSTEAAHIRFACEAIGKRHVGTSEKPDDSWTVPLCGAHHREQHQMREVEFWRRYDRDPLLIALALWRATGQHEIGLRIAREAGR